MLTFLVLVVCLLATGPALYYAVFPRTEDIHPELTYLICSQGVAWLAASLTTGRHWLGVIMGMLLFSEQTCLQVYNDRYRRANPRRNFVPLSWWYFLYRATISAVTMSVIAFELVGR